MTINIFSTFLNALTCIILKKHICYTVSNKTKNVYFVSSKVLTHASKLSFSSSMLMIASCISSTGTRTKLTLIPTCLERSIPRTLSTRPLFIKCPATRGVWGLSGGFLKSL